MRMRHSEDDGGRAPESPGEGPEAGQQTLPSQPPEEASLMAPGLEPSENGFRLLTSRTVRQYTYIILSH